MILLAGFEMQEITIPPLTTGTIPENEKLSTRDDEKGTQDDHVYIADTLPFDARFPSS